MCAFGGYSVFPAYGTLNQQYEDCGCFFVSLRQDEGRHDDPTGPNLTLSIEGKCFGMTWGPAPNV